MAEVNGRTRARAAAYPAFFLLLAAGYLALFLLLRTTTLYFPAGAHNDRLFSADDIYYVTEFFAPEPDDSLRIIKHPLLIAFGWGYTLFERAVFGEITPRMHYEGIVLFQMAVSLASTAVLARLLAGRYRLRTAETLLCCAVYACSFSVLFYTFVAESYILSSFLLLASFLYADREGTGSAVTLAVLGALCAGVTITNAALWALIVCFGAGHRGLPRRLAILAGGGLLFCAVTAAIPPIRTVFFPYLFSGAMNSARNYSDHYSVWEALKRIFYIFFGSTLFPLRMTDTSPFGDFAGSALSFLPSAGAAVTAVSALWAAVLTAVCIVRRKDRRLWGPAAVLLANLLLHGGIQYGLKEGFLYSLHHLGAQLCILALPLQESVRNGAAGRRRFAVGVTVLLCLVLAAEFAAGFTGGTEILRFLQPQAA